SPGPAGPAAHGGLRVDPRGPAGQHEPARQRGAALALPRPAAAGGDRRAGRGAARRGGARGVGRPARVHAAGRDPEVRGLPARGGTRAPGAVGGGPERALAPAGPHDRAPDPRAPARARGDGAGDRRRRRIRGRAHRPAAEGRGGRAVGVAFRIRRVEWVAEAFLLLRVVALVASLVLLSRARGRFEATVGYEAVLVDVDGISLGGRVEMLGIAIGRIES